jgi:4a-hydroxytetrahydrobiopterin dehydratase
MWQETDQGLYKKFTFKDFEEAFAFMGRVAAIAEAQQHHPKWTNEWNSVEIWLSTHDAGSKITDKDRKLAETIDKIVDGESEYEVIKP